LLHVATKCLCIGRSSFPMECQPEQHMQQVVLKLTSLTAVTTGRKENLSQCGGKAGGPRAPCCGKGQLCGDCRGRTNIYHLVFEGNRTCEPDSQAGHTHTLLLRRIALSITGQAGGQALAIQEKEGVLFCIPGPHGCVSTQVEVK